MVKRPSFNGPVKTDHWASLRGLKEEICYCGREGRSIENCSFFSIKLDFSHHISPALSFLLRQHILKHSEDILDSGMEIILYFRVVDFGYVFFHFKMQVVISINMI